MKIFKVRTAKNALACLVAVQVYAMQFFVPPYLVENEYSFNVEHKKGKQGVSRKLTKNNNNNFNSSNYRNARNSLTKPNYYGKPKDF